MPKWTVSLKEPQPSRDSGPQWDSGIKCSPSQGSDGTKLRGAVDPLEGGDASQRDLLAFF